jgi:hypothetical protein
MGDERIIKKCSGGRDGNLLFSPESGFWSNCPVPNVDPTDSAYEFFDNFETVCYDDVAAPWTIDTTNGTLTMAAAETAGLGGYATLYLAAATNNDLQMKVSTADTAAGPFKVTTYAAATATSGRKLWFEAKFWSPVITATTFYVGLIDGGCTQAGANATGARNMTSGIYFRTLQASSTAIDWCCSAASTETVVGTGIATLVASTAITLGFYFDGNKTVLPYVNGTLVNYPMSTALTNFPGTVGLTPVIYWQTGAIVAKTMYLDWVKCVQKRIHD